MSIRKRYETTPPAPFECAFCGSEKTVPVLHKTSFALKGSGWYKDGYKGKEEK